MNMVITIFVEDSNPDQGQDIADHVTQFLHDQMNVDAIALASPVSEVPPDPDVDDTLEGLSAEDEYDEDEDEKSDSNSFWDDMQS